eukprot:Awhi_evm2s421
MVTSRLGRRKLLLKLITRKVLPMVMTEILFISSPLYIVRGPFNPFNFTKLTLAVFNRSAIVSTDAAVDVLIYVVLESVSESEVNHILEISFLGNATTKLSNVHPKRQRQRQN